MSVMNKRMATTDQYAWKTWYQQHMRFRRIAPRRPRNRDVEAQSGDCITVIADDSAEPVFEVRGNCIRVTE